MGKNNNSKKDIREKARNKLIEMQKQLEDCETIQLLDEFKNKYNICETVYKVILKEHQNCKNNNCNKYYKVDMRQVPYALNFAGYEYDKELLNNLFGSKESSAKKIRDGITHGLDSKKIDEIKNRKKELFAYMDEFLYVIKNFDNVA